MKIFPCRVAYAISLSFFCFLALQNVKAADNSIHTISTNTLFATKCADTKRPADTVKLAPNIVIVITTDEVKGRFHFSITKDNNTPLTSASVTSDFTISNGFIAAFDARRAAILVAEKLKNGETAPSLTKAELAANHIAQP